MKLAPKVSAPQVEPPFSPLLAGDWMRDDGPTAEQDAKQAQYLSETLKATRLTCAGVDRVLAGLAEDFRSASRQGPNLWHMLVESDAADGDWKQYTKVDGKQIHYEGDWPVFSWWADADHRLFGVYFGADDCRAGFQRFKQLNRQAGKWYWKLVRHPGPTDVDQYWILQLYRAAFRGFYGLLTERRQRLENFIDFSIVDWVRIRRGDHGLSCIAEDIPRWPRTWYAILAPDLLSASALLVDHLRDVVSMTPPATAIDGWQPPRWFDGLTGGRLNDESLKKARLARKIKARLANTKSKRWVYDAMSVANHWTEHRKDILAALAATEK